MESVRLSVLALVVAAASLFAAFPSAPAWAVPLPQMLAYRPPVHAPVIDPFRPPRTAYGAGNRGLTYGTFPGQSVDASADGVVAYAGNVAGRLVISIDHADGLRTTYTRLRSIVVRRGESVRSGQRVGSAMAEFHFGVRRGRVYLDPATLFSVQRARVRVRLVPHGYRGAGHRVGFAERHRSPYTCRSVRRAVRLSAIPILHRGHPTVAVRCAGPDVAQPRGNQGDDGGRSHHEAIVGSRRSLRASDPSVEPEDEAIHLR